MKFIKNTSNIRISGRIHHDEQEESFCSVTDLVPRLNQQRRTCAYSLRGDHSMFPKGDAHNGQFPFLS